MYSIQFYLNSKPVKDAEFKIKLVILLIIMRKFNDGYKQYSFIEKLKVGGKFRVCENKKIVFLVKRIK